VTDPLRQAGVVLHDPPRGNGSVKQLAPLALNELLPDIMESRIELGLVFDRTIGLDGVPDRYRAMNEREALKVLIRA
jgi:hypothetical protein